MSTEDLASSSDSGRGRRLGLGAVTLALSGLLLSTMGGNGSVAAPAAVPQKLAAIVSKSAMQEAVVPSLCGHPAGRLIGGSLPGVAQGMGGVWLDRVVVGRVGNRNLVAASISCNQGGIGWPGNLVVYSSPDKIVGTFPLSDFTSGGRQQVSKLRISKGKIRLRILAIAAPDDNDLWGSRSALAKFSWSKRRHAVVRSSLKVYDERRAATRLVAALRRGDVRTARKYATAEVVGHFMDSPHRRGLKLGKCVGVDSKEWFRVWSSAPSRQCLVTYDVGAATVLMEHKTWKTFKAVDVRGVAGA